MHFFATIIKKAIKRIIKVIDLKILSDKKILLVDGERDLAEAIARAIRSSGGSVEVVFDGVQAIDALSQRTFDIVLIGEKISRRPCGEVAEMFKNAGGKRAICIIDSYGLEKKEEGAFDGFLLAPFDNEKLISALVGELSE